MGGVNPNNSPKNYLFRSLSKRITKIRSFAVLCAIESVENISSNSKFHPWTFHDVFSLTQSHSQFSSAYSHLLTTIFSLILIRHTHTFLFYLSKKFPTQYFHNFQKKKKKKKKKKK